MAGGSPKPNPPPEVSSAQQATSRVPPVPVRQWRVEATAFQGPLPPPDLLIRYNDAFMGCAERIVKMAETQAAHRQAIETRAIGAKIGNERVGQWMAFAIAMAAVCGSIWLMSIDRFGAGATLFGGTLVSLVSLFLYARAQQRKQLQDKAAPFGPRDIPPP
jgi:uncharacterized membrane protein